MAQTLLHDEQHGAGPAGMDVDDPVGGEADGGQRGRVDVGPLHDPQHGPRRLGEQGRGEERGRGGVFGLGARPGEFVQRAGGDPAAGERPVDGGQAEPEAWPAWSGAGMPLQARQLGSEGRKNGIV